MKRRSSGLDRMWLVLFACLIATGSWAKSSAPGSLGTSAGDESVTARRIGSVILPGVYQGGLILRASDPRASDRFSHSMAISGDTAVLGAWGEDGGAGNPISNAGAAYVFERNHGGTDNWGEVAKLTASDAQKDDWFGWSVAISGDTVVVGARTEGGVTDPAYDTGAAYVFERDHGGTDNWGEVVKLTASDAQEYDFFGGNVAISGDTVIVSAEGEDGGSGSPISNVGAAYVFERDHGGTDNWGERAKLTASDAQTLDGFGSQVSISGDTAVVGAKDEDGGVSNNKSSAGAAYVFERDQGGTDTWGEVAKLTASDAQVADYFGISVGISADTIVAGATAEDGGAGDPITNAGAVYVFSRNSGGVGNWGEVAKLSASDAEASDSFGRVSVAGDLLVVGAYVEDGGPGDPINLAGAAYIFTRAGGGAGSWGEITKLTASDAQVDDRFGEAVAVSGRTVLVGAPREDGGAGDPAADAGAAYVFVGTSVRLFIADLPTADPAESLK